MGNSEILMPTL